MRCTLDGALKIPGRRPPRPPGAAPEHPFRPHLAPKGISGAHPAPLGAQIGFKVTISYAMFDVQTPDPDRPKSNDQLCYVRFPDGVGRLPKPSPSKCRP